MKKNIILIIIIILLVLIGVGVWYWQGKSYSKEILKFEILGPEKATLAQEVEYTVKFKNNGSERLENPELSFEFPDDSILEDNQTKVVTLTSEELGGDIYPGEERSFKFKARLLGKEGDTKEAKATIVFQPKGLNTKNELSTTFITTIEKVPVNLTLDLPSYLGVGKNFSFNINYLSSTPYPLKDLTIKVFYPSDFEFLSSNPKLIDSDTLNVSNLDEGMGGKIEISGILRGSVKDQKVFKTQLGVWSSDGNFIVLREVIKGVELIAPSLYITQEINGNPQYIVNPGDLLHYEILFRNIGEEPLADLVLISRLEGDIFDFYSIQAPEGDFKPGDNSIIWEGTKVSKLQFLNINEQGKVEFWIKAKNKTNMTTLAQKNPQVKNLVTISQAKEEFVNKVNSVVEGEQKAEFSDLYFDNFGFYPLKIGEPTKFTLKWSIKNYYNDLANVRMEAVLPESVVFTGKIFPENNSGLTYDPVSREISWEVGDVPAGSGVLDEGKICAFQLEIRPTQKDDSNKVLLIKEAKITAEDQWTKATLTATVPEVFGDVE